VRANAKEIGMPGLLAVDRNWEVLKRWEGPEKRTFTSLTFLLDKKGRIRHVHSGGEVTADEGKELSRKIDALLAEE
jgi:alkyl hydroperoxide reductase subunit AhpC